VTHIIAGIDPGLSGAIAFFVPSHNRVAVYDMPVIDGEVDVIALGQLARAHWPEMAIIEKVGAMPGNGSVSMFNFGRSVGCVLGAFGALYVPMHSVTPQKWKSEYGLIGQDKEASRKLAIELFPAIAGDLKLKKHHGRAEAALIAMFGADKFFLKQGAKE
jgi:crossover junction endodeoxyribonuclease RuvC